MVCTARVKMIICVLLDGSFQTGLIHLNLDTVVILANLLLSEYSMKKFIGIYKSVCCVSLKYPRNQ